MNVLIVHAHPEPKSFNGAMKDLAVRVLTGQGHTVQVSDLYAMGFNPVCDRGDFLSLGDPNFFKPQREQQRAFREQTFAPDVAAEQTKVQWADLVIFQFPLWWDSMPAIMKGWIDRVFASGFAYGGGRWYSDGAFRGKRAMLAITTAAGTDLYSPRGLNGDLHEMLLHIHHGMLYFCGFTVLQPFIAWSVARVGDQARGRFLDEYRQYLLSLDSVPALPFHPVQ